MNEQLNLVDTESATPTTLCANCHEPFAPRTGSGGKPQRFCTEQCRRQFHGLKGPTPTTPDAAPDVGATPIAPEQTLSSDKPKAPPLPGFPERSHDFDWIKTDCIVLREQRETAIYWNPYGNLVIRQRADWDEDNDPFLVICANNVRRIGVAAKYPAARRRELRFAPTLSATLVLHCQLA
jgi:hypothetical protein